MSDKSAFLQPKNISPAEQLRAQLTALENDLPALPKQSAADVQTFFREMDAAQLQFSQLMTDGVDLTAELTRFETVQSRIARNADRLLHAIGGAAKLREHRPANISRKTHPWWFVDEISAEQKARTRKRVLTILGIAAAIVLAVVVLFNTVLKPDPAVVAKTRHFQTALDLVMEAKDYPAALDEIEQALNAVPNDVDSLVFKAVLLAQMGDESQADNILAQANALAPDDMYVPLAQARLLQQMGNLRQSLSLAEGVIAAHPDSAEAWYIAGQAHAGLGDIPQAREALSKAAELALAQGNDSLYVIAKTNLTYLSPLGGNGNGGQ